MSKKKQSVNVEQDVITLIKNALDNVLKDMSLDEWIGVEQFRVTADKVLSIDFEIKRDMIMKLGNASEAAVKKFGLNVRWINADGPTCDVGEGNRKKVLVGMAVLRGKK